MFLITTQTLDRKEAIRRLNLIVGKDLRAMADEYQIEVWKNGRKNKGWAGLVLERYLGLAQNSRQAPDFGTWDLKLVALHYARDGSLRVKESMAITMLEPTEMLASKFENSHFTISCGARGSRANLRKCGRKTLHPALGRRVRSRQPKDS